jgi:hypothetical protein
MLAPLNLGAQIPELGSAAVDPRSPLPVPRSPLPSFFLDPRSPSSVPRSPFDQRFMTRNQQQEQQKDAKAQIQLGYAGTGQRFSLLSLSPDPLPTDFGHSTFPSDFEVTAH